MNEKLVELVDALIEEATLLKKALVKGEAEESDFETLTVKFDELINYDEDSEELESEPSGWM